MCRGIELIGYFVDCFECIGWFCYYDLFLVVMWFFIRCDGWKVKMWWGEIGIFCLVLGLWLIWVVFWWIENVLNELILMVLLLIRVLEMWLSIFFIRLVLLLCDRLILEWMVFVKFIWVNVFLVIFIFLWFWKRLGDGKIWS